MKIWLSVFVSLLLLAGCGDSAYESQWQTDPKGVLAASFDNLGNRVLIANLKHEAILYSLKDSQPLYHFQLPNKAPIIHVLLKGHTALTAGRSRIALWDIQKGKSLGVLPAPFEISAVDLSDDQRWLIIGSENGIASVYDLIKGKWLGQLSHGDSVNTVALNHNGTLALTGGDDKVTLLWDLKKGKVLQTFKHKARVTRVAFAKAPVSGDQILLSSSALADSYLFSTTGELVQPLKLHPKLSDWGHKEYLTLSSARFYHDNKHLLTGSPPRHLRLWDLETGEVVQTWVLPKASLVKPRSAIVYSAAFDQTGQKVLAACADGNAYRLALN